MTQKKTVNKNYRYYRDQSWSCTGCGKCCTMWDIPVTKEEKKRLEKLIIPGFDFKNEDFFLPMRKSSNLFLIRKKNNQCIFLDTDGLCIIHKLHGEAVKALACRLYPFHILKWQDGVISVSYRFDCTAVSTNNGSKISKQEKEIGHFISELTKNAQRSTTVYNKKISPPLKNLRTLALSYKNIIFDDKFDLNIRLYYASTLVDFHEIPEHVDFIMKMNPEFRHDTLKYLRERGNDFRYVIESAEPPDKVLNMVFSYILSGYARVDEETSSGILFSGRIKRAYSILKFITGSGSLKKLSKDYPDTYKIPIIKTMEKSILEWDAKEILKRYTAVQLEAMHFCGNPGLNLTFEEGIRHLIMFIPVTIAIASLHAAARQKNSDYQTLFISRDDMASAVRITDHTFYHSPFFKLRHVKKMIKWMLNEKKFPSILKLIS
jgi:Fe-S-cluster containining protein